MSNSSTLPNPVVYLNYLPPELAFTWELTRNVYLVTCGALIWDILSSIPKDLRILRRFNAGTIAYGLCRPAALAFVMTATVTKTLPLPDCQAMTIGIACSSMVATGTSSFLFLLRVRAVYSHSKLVKYAFCVLWLVQIGLSALLPLGASAGPLYDTGYCINTGVKKFVIAAAFMPPFFDTLVFGFISYHLVTKHANSSDHLHWRTFFSGKALPQLSKALLQGGQQYYLLATGPNVAIIALGASSVPKILRIIPIIPGIAIALTSAMACNVQRNLSTKGRQGTESEEPETVELSGLSFTDISSFLTRSYRSQEASNDTGSYIGAQSNTILEVPMADQV